MRYLDIISRIFIFFCEIYNLNEFLYGSVLENLMKFYESDLTYFCKRKRKRWKISVRTKKTIYMQLVLKELKFKCQNRLQLTKPWEPWFILHGEYNVSPFNQHFQNSRQFIPYLNGSSELLPVISATQFL